MPVLVFENESTNLLKGLISIRKIAYRSTKGVNSKHNKLPRGKGRLK